MVITIGKQLATAQDIAHGVGKVSQQRGGMALELDKVDIALGLATETELSSIDPATFPRVRIGSKEFQAQGSVFQAAFDVKPVVYIAGAVLTQDNPYVYYAGHIYERTEDLPYTLVNPSTDELVPVNAAKWYNYLGATAEEPITYYFGVVYTEGLLSGDGADDTAALQELLDNNPRTIVRLHTDIRLTSNLTEGSLDNIKLDFNGYSIHVDHAGRLVTSTTISPAQNVKLVNGRVFSNEDGDSDYLAGNSVISLSNSYVDNMTFTNWGEDALNLVDNNVVGSVYFDEIRDNCIVFRGSNSIVMSSKCGHVSGDYILYKGYNNHVIYAQADTVGFRKNASNSWPDFGGAGSGIVFGADTDDCSHCSFGFLDIGICAAYVVTADPAASYCIGGDVVVDSCYFDNQYPKSSGFSNAYVALLQGRHNTIRNISARSYPWGLAFGGTRNHHLTVDSFKVEEVTAGTILNMEGTGLTDIRVGDFFVDSCKNSGAVRILADKVKIENFQVLDGASGGATAALQISGNNVEFDQLKYTGHQFPASPATWTVNTNYSSNTGLVLSGTNYWVKQNHKAGIWLARTKYLVDDYVYDLVTTNRYKCLIDNTASKDQAAGFASDLALGYWVLDGAVTDLNLIGTDVRLGYIRLEGSRNATAIGMLVTGDDSRFGYLQVKGFDGYNLVLDKASDIDKFHLEGSPNSYDDVLRVQGGITQVLSGGTVVPSNGYHTEVREGSTLIFTNNNALDAVQDDSAGSDPALSRVINANNTLGYLPKQKVEVFGGATALTLSTTLAAINLQATGFTNTVDIMGASLSTTDITLPAGRYELYIEALLSKSDGSAGQLVVTGQVSVTSGDIKVISLPAGRAGLVASGASAANISAVRELTLNQTSVVQIQFDGSTNTTIEGTLAESKNFYLKITEA